VQYKGVTSAVVVVVVVTPGDNTAAHVLIVCCSVLRLCLCEGGGGGWRVEVDVIDPWTTTTQTQTWRRGSSGVTCDFKLSPVAVASHLISSIVLSWI